MAGTGEAQELPSREERDTTRHRDKVNIRSLDGHAAAPDRVIAGVEVGGVHVGDDRGTTWIENGTACRTACITCSCVARGEHVVSCGDGLYRATDAGRSWTRPDGELSHRYFREALLDEGRLYAAARSPPGTWQGESGADGAMFVSDDRGDSFGGQLSRRTGGGWKSSGTISAGIHSLCTAEPVVRVMPQRPPPGV